MGRSFNKHLALERRDQTLKKELTLAGNSDITVAITEPMNGRAEVHLPIKV